MKLPRLFLLPRWVLIVALVVYAILLIAKYCLGNDDIDAGIWALLMYATVGYGIARVACFHPGMRRKYAEWLATVPWSSRMPLPLGPVHLVWQDALVVGAFCLIARLQLHGWPLWPPLAFVVSYLAALAMLVLAENQRYCAWLIAMGICGVMWALPDLSWAAGILIGTYLVAYVGLRRSLAAAQWKPVLILTPKAQCYWPVSSDVPRASCDLTNTVLLSILAGLACYAACQTLEKYMQFAQLELWNGLNAIAKTKIPLAVIQRNVMAQALRTLEDGLLPQLIGWTCAASVVRLAIYCLRPGVVFWPPMNLLGRLATGRLIIPGYDHVFVAPALAIIASILLPHGLLYLGLDLDAAALTLAFVVFIELGVGPDLRTWQLTGTHRIVWFLGNQRITQQARAMQRRH